MKTLTGPQLVFDHIAVIARTLEEGAEHVRQCLGVEMPQGGKHPIMGTHNLLLSLSDTEFLEVIAIDPDAPKPERKRWFGLDEFEGAPRIGAWIAGTSDIAQSLQQAPEECGQAIDVTRDHLFWKFAFADDGNPPMDGAFPTLIEWQEGPHPAGRMKSLGCGLTRLEVYHPEAEKIEATIAERFSDPRIELIKGAKAFKAFIETPSGIKLLT